MTSRVLALDGGNTKSVGVVANLAGAILGVAVGGCGDIYGASSVRSALDELEGVARRALVEAASDTSQLVAVAASLAGADWPEDSVLYESELRRRLGLKCEVEVMNDGLGPLRLGRDDGIGVAVAVGTGLAIGARGPSGRIWHSSFWPAFGAVASLGRLALDAVLRSELGLAPSTALVDRLLAKYQVSDVRSLLHVFTRREGPLPVSALRDLNETLLDAEVGGDEVAALVIDRYAQGVSEYVLAAARIVGFTDDYLVVLTGGLLSSSASTLGGRLASYISSGDSRAVLSRPKVLPVAGAVLEALSLAGTLNRETRHRVLRSPAVQGCRVPLVAGARLCEGTTLTFAHAGQLAQSAFSASADRDP